jgi:DNA-binding LacI/PurR family transcriptional regulator
LNLEEVAKRANVSTATVSRVVNDTGLVKPSTRARVLKAISELNYHPNLHARTLAGGQSRTIGMIVSNLENPFFLDIFSTVEGLAHAGGYEVLVANTNYNSDQLVRTVRHMIGRRVTGLAVIVSEMEPALIDLLTNSPIPVVFYDVGTARKNITNIRVNYRTGIEQAVSYLHDLGHRRIAFVGHHSGLGPIDERVQSLLTMVARFEPQIDVVRIADADGLEGGRRAVRRLLTSRFRPTAIMCVNDFMAIGVLRELRDQGLRVPGDVSVTGCDNISLSEYVHPTLTTIHIPRDDIGRMVFESLLPSGNSTTGNGCELVVEPEFLVRESTAPPPGC